MKKGEVKKKIEPTIISEPIDVVKKFITDNELDFSGSGSDLNGNCVILAGFICYIVDAVLDGRDIIDDLKISIEARTELLRIFDYAWTADYELFWETPEAKEKYKF